MGNLYPIHDKKQMLLHNILLVSAVMPIIANFFTHTADFKSFNSELFQNQTLKRFIRNLSPWMSADLTLGAHLKAALGLKESTKL